MYDFRTLNDEEFERFSRDLLSTHLHIDFQSFKSGKDKGIDLRFTTTQDERTIVQCKHYLKTGFNGLCRTLESSEMPKVAKLNPDRYLLSTSVDMSPQDADAVLKILAPFCKTTQDLFWQTRLNDVLRENPEIEYRHFKLWLSSVKVLQAVLKTRILNQGELTLAEIEDRVRLYVQTTAFDEAEEKLGQNRICIIAGGPGIGKTTLAEMLLLHYIGKGYQPFVLADTIDDGVDAWNAEAQQVFYFDDFFGRDTVELGRNEGEKVIRFLDRIKKSNNKVMIITTREYVLNKAKLKSERLAQYDWNTQELVLDMHKFSKLDQAKILYNHIYFSGLPNHYRSALLADNNYRKIIDHPKWNPRLVERMTLLLDVSAVKPDDYVQMFLSFLDDPQAVWEPMRYHQRVCKSLK